MQTQHSLAHPLKKVLIGLVDAAIVMGMCWQYAQYVEGQSPSGGLGYAVPPVVGVVGVFMLYRLCCLLLLNGTPGMKLFKVIFLNGEDAELSFYEKLLAACFILYRGIDYYEKKVSIH